MAIIDLKRPKPKPESIKNQPEAAMSSSSEERSYNLRFTLEKPELDKLGVKSEDFKAGTKGKAAVEIEVITVRSVDSASPDKWDRDHNNSIELQVLGIDLGQMKPKEKTKRQIYDEQMGRIG